jgi:hypothetical protein
MPYVDAVLPEDDMFHRRNDDPYWNESSFVSFIVPERGLQGMLYFYFRPNMGLAVAGPMLWDSSGQDQYNCLHYGWDQCMAMPAGTDMYNFALPNTFAARTGTLLKEYQFTYSALGLDMDLTWHALMEPHLMRLQSDESINPGIADYVQPVDQLSIGHYEQAGRLSGTITLRGERIEVDSGSLRDHTWGPRPMFTTSPVMRGAYPFCVADDDHHFQLYAMQETPEDEDPIIGTTERVVSGWYVKDGIKGDLVSGTRRCTVRDAQGLSRHEVIEATDHLGRVLRAEADLQSWFKFTLYSDLLDVFSLAKWSFDGREVWGESQDYMLFRQYRKLFLASR